MQNKYECLVPVFCSLFILNKSLMVYVCLRGKKWSSITKSVAFHSQPSFFCSQLKAPPAISNGSEMFSIVFLENFLFLEKSYFFQVFAHHFRFSLFNFFSILHLPRDVFNWNRDLELALSLKGFERWSYSFSTDDNLINWNPCSDCSKYILSLVWDGCV